MIRPLSSYMMTLHNRATKSGAYIDDWIIFVVIDVYCPFPSCAKRPNQPSSWILQNGMMKSVFIRLTKNSNVWVNGISDS